MYHQLVDFRKDWQIESSGTLKTLQVLTEPSLQQRVSPQGRTLGRIAWHIVTSLGEMAGRMGLPVEAPAEDAALPTTAIVIAEAYAKAAESLGQSIQKWSDGELDKEDDMYGENWKRGYSLAVLLRHEIHHRGQMTVLMRQAGLQVPGLCGPSAEEWAKFGMPAQA
jgi:uncharacterized damage-inducible protein DinB